MSEHSWRAGAQPEQWWAFYVRVTREESVTADLSIPNQIARAKEIASARGWPYFKIYVEPRHVSAELWVDKRPALRELLDDVAADRVLGVCARHTDRLWRNNEIQGRVLRALRERNCELWDFTSRFDYRSAHGKFSLQVLGAASELEVNLTAERIREMKRGKAMKGKTGGGPPPFGYTSQSRRILELIAAGRTKDEAYREACIAYPIGKCWYVDEREAEVVRLIFDLYTGEHRYGCKRIVGYLNERGYRTRHGAQWHGNYVTKVINNPVYAGFTSFDELAYEQKAPSCRPRREQTLYQGEHPALVTPEVWRRAQQIKTSENALKRPRRGKANDFTLTGMLHCPTCGRHLIGKASPHSPRRYYICSRRHTGGPRLCSFPLLNAVALQRALWDWLHGILSDPSLVLTHMERLAKRMEATRPEVERHIATAERRRDEIRGALAKYFQLLESSPDHAAASALLDRVGELRGELQTVENEVVELRAKAPPPRRALTVQEVERALDRVRAKLDEHPKRQHILLQEFKREHDLTLAVKSREEVEASIKLRAPTTGQGEWQVQRHAMGLRSTAAPNHGPWANAVEITGTLRIARNNTTVPRWVEAENAKGHTCACGCGELIRVLPVHHSRGIPRFAHGHHAMAASSDTKRLNANGLLTSRQVAERLGIGVTTLLRLEGELFKAPPRRGRRRIRVFSVAAQKRIAKAIARRKAGST